MSMASKTAILGILRADGLRLARDRFLVGTALYIVVLSVGMRWLLPWVTAEVNARLAFDLEPYHPLFMSHMIVVLAGLTGGFVGGFLLLEGREDRTVKAQLVTPVPLSVHVTLVSVVIALSSAILTIVEGAIVGIALPPWPALVAIAIAGAPAAPMLALFIASFADDKVEAFAYTKFCSVAMLVPGASFFVPEPWQWIAGIYPQWWAAKAFWIAEAGGSNWPALVAAGLAVSALWVYPLARRFSRVARK
jgi:fluoroquinolone transport system permease protein